jgi:hypothetical protein
LRPACALDIAETRILCDTGEVISIWVVHMESNKLKIKIGDHEFEAEGPPDVVQAQFAAFKELVTSAVATATPRNTQNTSPPGTKQDQDKTGSSDGLLLDKIMKVDGRVVSLTARAPSLSDAILLVIFGQKHFRSNDGITGGEIIDGLRQSGQAVDRIDRTLEKLAAEGLIIKLGTGRASRYRMTNLGVSKAQEVARDVIGLVA